MQIRTLNLVLLCALMSAIVLQGCDVINGDDYSVGTSRVTLTHIAETDTYIDQYQRVWALISVNNEHDVFKAIPAGKNKCLLESIGWHPYITNDTDFGKYIYADGRCHIKQTPEKSYTFDVMENAAIKIVYEACPPGTALSEKGFCYEAEENQGSPGEES